MPAPVKSLDRCAELSPGINWFQGSSSPCVKDSLSIASHLGLELPVPISTKDNTPM